PARGRHWSPSRGMAASAGIVRADRLHRADDLPTKITSTGLAVASGAMTIPEVERDKSLEDKLTEENAAILAWVVEGCRSSAPLDASYRGQAEQAGDKKILTSAACRTGLRPQALNRARPGKRTSGASVGCGFAPFLPSV